MYKNIGDYYIENNLVKDKEHFKLSLTDQTTIYEVVRVINNRILFLKDHMKRLRYSLEHTKKPSDIVMDIEEALYKLVELHPNLDKNIKIDICENYYRVYFMESFYPDKTFYDTGVDVIHKKIVRKDPSVKQLNMDYKRHIEEIKGNKYFEVLLMNEEGYVIEGSRSNLLFIIDNKVFSAPLDDILEGITFKNVLRICEEEGIPIVYKSVHERELDKVDACFLTGTSLGVLPIASIGKKKFRSSKHSIVLKLIEAYNSNR